MQSETQGITKQYSTAFKRKVVSEIESGKLSINQARSIYSISGGGTIQNWIKKWGKEAI
jgi:transposase-like protein